MIAILLGVLLALTLPPLPTGVLAPIVLAALLYFVSQADDVKGVASRLFWAVTALNAVHLEWLMTFVGQLVGLSALGFLAFLLYALEGSFYALMGYLVARLIKDPLGRVWGLAGGWVLLEMLRFLGPFAFPWPTLGYSLLPTPMIQIADLGGVMLGSVLVTFTAAALVSFWQGRAAPLWLAAACWVAALAYGVTRTPANGEIKTALLQRTNIDSFAKIYTSPQDQFQIYNRLTGENRKPGEVPIWTETAIRDPMLLNIAPAGGIYGVSGGFEVPLNQAVAWTGREITGRNDKARPVPFGEYFPLRQALAPAWRMIEQITHMNLETLPAARTLNPLPLNGVQYGAYVCYDSVFPWVARQLTNKGANVLVNISNDAWYAGWGVQQHFMMGRVRAIENRRWVLRSVNKGIAGSIDDLGRPQQTLSAGEGVLHAAFPVLHGQTFFNRVGNWPVLILALLMVGYGLIAHRRTT